jgi:serine/threonine protein kinase
MHQLLTAVAFCHGNNVLHRDIKPQHIFINAQQQLKLGGFCLARTVDFPVPMANEARF